VDWVFPLSGEVTSAKNDGGPIICHREEQCYQMTSSTLLSQLASQMAFCLSAKLLIQFPSWSRLLSMSACTAAMTSSCVSKMWAPAERSFVIAVEVVSSETPAMQSRGM
jgi:hypothetical protein